MKIMRLGALMALCVFATSATYATTDHVYFVGTDNNIHEDWYNNGSWVTEDTTVNSPGAPATISQSPLASVVLGQSGSISAHIYFIDGNYNIGECYYNTAWHYTNDSSASGGHTANPGSALKALQTGTYSFHVFFWASDGNLGDIWFDGTNFHYDEPNALAGAPAPVSGTFIDAVYFGGAEYVFYVNSSGEMEVLSYTSSWTHTELSSYYGSLAYNTPFNAFSYNEHGTTPYMFILYWTGAAIQGFQAPNGTSWSQFTPTQLSGDPSMNPMTATVYGSSLQNADFFYIPEENDSLIELRLNLNTQSTVVSYGNAYSPNTNFDRMCALYGVRNVEVYYLNNSSPSHLIQAYGNESSWNTDDLTANPGGGLPAGGPGLTAIEW